VSGVEDDEPARIGEDRPRRKAVGIDDSELTNGSWIGTGSDKIGDGTDRDAVLVGETARV
jgi:hypothetical protein